MKKENLLKSDLREKLFQILKTESIEKRRYIRMLEDYLENISEEYEINDEDINSLVADLHMDLAFFQPNFLIRLTDKSLLDENQLNIRIEEYLSKLK